MTSLREVAALFFKLGVVGFGGPAAHIAMMEDEVVTRRGWLDRGHFLDLVGATNLIPGPNSTEMTMHVGYTVAGRLGLIVAGASFIFPAALATGFLAWLYTRFGTLPQVEPLLFGIKPVVLAIILGAIWRLGRAAAKNGLLVAVGTAVALATLAGLNEVLALFSGGLLGMLLIRWRQKVGGKGQGAALFLPLSARRLLPPLATLPLPFSLAVGAAPTLWQLGLFFVMIGSILYGSGYVLIAFLEGWMVNDFGWLTQQQLLDAIAIGQFTPGPVLTTSTFIGFQIAGIPGAIVSTVGIFLPSFFFVAILNPIVPRLRDSAWTAAFLDAVNISAVGLMAAVMINLGRDVLTSLPAWIIALAAAFLSLRWKVSSPLLVVAGAIAGWLMTMFLS